MTGLDGKMYVVQSTGKTYAHAHPALAAHLCGKASYDPAEGNVLVSKALTKGYLRIACLPTILGITVDRAALAHHADRILVVADLVGARVLRVEVVHGATVAREVAMRVVWHWETDPTRPSRVPFERAFKEMVDATANIP